MPVPKASLSTGAVGGIAVAGALIALALISFLLCWYRRRQFRRGGVVDIDEDPVMVMTSDLPVEQFIMPSYRPLPSSTGSFCTPNPFSLESPLLTYALASVFVLGNSNSSGKHRSPRPPPGARPSAFTSYRSTTTSTSDNALKYQSEGLRKANPSKYQDVLTTDAAEDEIEEVERDERLIEPLSSGEPEMSRHRDAGPVGVSLGRSLSGRLPPAYGELL